MKSITTLLFTVLLFKTFAQTQQVFMTHDMDSSQQTMLLAYPNNPQKFICVQRYYNFTSSENAYSFLEMEGMSYTPLILPLITTITTAPIEFNNVIVFGGKSTVKGIELCIFDGVSTQIIDIQAGPASSAPELSLSNGRLFIVARSGSLRQLFELKNDLTLDQITQETPIDVRQFIIEKDDNIYYATSSYDTTYNTYGIDTIYTVKKINESTQTVTPLFSKKGSVAVTPVALDQNIYFVLEYNGVTPPPEEFYTTKKVVRINDDNSHTILLADSSTQNYDRRTLFTFENTLYIASDIDSVLLGTNDGISINTVLDFADSLRFKEVILENNTCHLILGNVFYDNFQVYSFGNNIADLVYSFDYHGHYLTEKDNHRYYATFPSPGSLDQNAYLIEMNLINGDIDTFHITNEAMHPPYYFGDRHGAVWFGNSFYFIYGNMMNSESEDIYRFDSSLGINQETDDELTFSIYPNPLQNNLLMIDCNEKGIIDVHAIDGRRIESFELNKGKNELDFEHYSPGTYFITQKGKSKKLIIP